MNDQPRHRLAEIDLAHVGDFPLGAMLVRPSVREVAYGAASETLEPRVMQVLVALAQAGGAVVSRDDLIVRCWEGRIVGEDAINRVIGRLRRLSELDDGASFAIETIPRVGYRLTAVGAAALFSIPSMRLPVAVAEKPADAVPATAIRPIKRGWFIALGAAVALAAAAGLAVWFMPRPAEWSIDEFRAVVSTPLYENDPALAPNGDMIAYAAGPAPYAWHIFIRNLSDGQPIQLTNGPDDDDLQPVWSPSGDRIAFVRHHEGEPCAIVVKPVPAGDEHIAARCAQDDFSTLTWSTQGDTLYYSDRADAKSPRHILRLDLASGATTPVTHPPVGILGDMSPRISPDGRKMLFVRLNPASYERRILDLADGSEQTVVAAADGTRPGEAWVDDGSVAVTLGGLAEPSLWLYPLAGAPYRLGVNPEEFGHISRGPDGLFAVEILQNRTVLAVPPDDANGTPLVEHAMTGVSTFPDYASDGRLAFAHVGTGGRWEIWIQPPGGEPHQLTAMSASYICGIHWSPDGRQLAFYTTVGDRWGIYLIQADGTHMHRVVASSNRAGWPAWTADSRALMYAVKGSEGWRLWRAPLDHPEQAKPMSDYGWFSIHAHGNELYALNATHPGIWRIDGVPRHVADLPRRCTDGFIECQTWFVSGTTLIFADHRVRTMPRFILHSLVDGTERSIAAPALDYTDAASLNPVTGKLLYVYDGQGDSDIALFHLTRR